MRPTTIPKTPEGRWVAFYDEETCMCDHTEHPQDAAMAYALEGDMAGGDMVDVGRIRSNESLINGHCFADMILEALNNSEDLPPQAEDWPSWPGPFKRDKADADRCPAFEGLAVKLRGAFMAYLVETKQFPPPWSAVPEKSYRLDYIGADRLRQLCNDMKIHGINPEALAELLGPEFFELVELSNVTRHDRELPAPGGVRKPSPCFFSLMARLGTSKDPAGEFGQILRVASTDLKTIMASSAGNILKGNRGLYDSAFADHVMTEKEAREAFVYQPKIHDPLDKLRKSAERIDLGDGLMSVEEAREKLGISPTPLEEVEKARDRLAMCHVTGENPTEVFREILTDMGYDPDQGFEWITPGPEGESLTKLMGDKVAELARAKLEVEP